MKSTGATPIACPSCGSSQGLREVLYGLPEFPVNEERYILGGCCPGGPEWICISCKWGIEEPDDFELDESIRASNGA